MRDHDSHTVAIRNTRLNTLIVNYTHVWAYLYVFKYSFYMHCQREESLLVSKQLTTFFFKTEYNIKYKVYVINSLYKYIHLYINKYLNKVPFYFLIFII